MSTMPKNLEPLVNHVELVEKRTRQLMRDKEFDPFERNNFREVIAEMDNEDLDLVCTEFRRAYVHGGASLGNFLHEQALLKAHKEAQRQIDEETNDCVCRGSGCSSCEGENT